MRARAALRGAVARLRARAAFELRRRRLRRSAFAWIRPPGNLTGRRVCVLSSYGADGAIGEQTAILAKAWHDAGFATLLVVATADFTAAKRTVRDLPDWLDAFAVRDNCGYDFGSWQAVLRRLPDTRRVALLALANDSVFGPLHPLTTLIERVEASPADVVGLTDSFEVRRHFQSYLIFYKPRAVRHRAFRTFWRRRAAGGRHDVIFEAEIPQLARLESGGLTAEALYARDPANRLNPLLTDWRRLIADGFPFLKIALLRDNQLGSDLTGWDRVLAAHGFDPEIAHRQLGTVVAASAVLPRA